MNRIKNILFLTSLVCFLPMSTYVFARTYEGYSEEANIRGEIRYQFEQIDKLKSAWHKKTTWDQAKSKIKNELYPKWGRTSGANAANAKRALGEGWANLAKLAKSGKKDKQSFQWFEKNITDLFIELEKETGRMDYSG